MLPALLTACSGADLLNATVSTDSYRRTEGLAYGTDPRQLIDVYQPAAGASRAPLVVFFYGGSWSSGERGDYRFVGEALASRGIVAMVADYRLSPAVRYPAFVQDSASAVRWAVDHAARFGADEQRIFVMGHSAGAYNAAMVALDARWLAAVGLAPSRLAGWIGLAGPYDFLPMGDPSAQRAFDWPNTPRSSQPIAHVSTAAPRTLLLAATKDTLVDPVRNTGQMARRLRAEGVDVQVQTFDNLSHVTLIGAVATPIRWIGGPVVPPILQFVGLPSDLSHKPPR